MGEWLGDEGYTKIKAGNYKKGCIFTWNK